MVTHPSTLIVERCARRHWIIGNYNARDAVRDLQQVSRNTAKLVSRVIALGTRDSLTI